MSFDKEQIKRVIEGYIPNRNTLVGDTITNVVSAFNEVIESVYPDIEANTTYLDLYDRWLVLVGSKIYTGYDMTIMSCSINDNRLLIDIEFSDIPYNKKIDLPIDGALGNHFAKVLGQIFKSSQFRGKIEIYNELSSKDKYDLTVFDVELFRYTPTDLHLNISKELIKQLKISTDIFEISNQEIIHQPRNFEYYRNKYGVVNGIKFKVNEATTNRLIVKKIG